MKDLLVDHIGVITLEKGVIYDSAPANATSVIAQPAVVGDENGRDYALTNFAPCIDFVRSNGNTDRIFQKIVCSLRIPALSFRRDTTASIDIASGVKGGRTVLPMYSVPLGRIQPQDATVEIEFRYADTVIGSIKLPVKFTDEPAW